MTYSKERIKFSNLEVHWYFFIVGWGKTGPAHPPPNCFGPLFYLSVFWIMLLFHCILTLMNDLFQKENQVFKPTGLLVLLHCGVGKDWASPFFPPPKCFGLHFYLSIFWIMLLFNCILINTYERPVQKRESSFQTNKFISTSTLWGGERLGWPILSPLQNVLIFLSIF